MNPFEPGADLVILLDISRSMDVADVNPYRLERARQEVQDLIRANPGVSVGLIAFASLFPIMSVLAYAQYIEWRTRRRQVIEEE